MKNLILLILSVTLLSGCVTQDRCSRKFPPEIVTIRTDSIIRTTETVFRDTIVYIHIPAEVQYSTDTVIIKDGIIQSRKNHLTTSFAQSWAWVERGRLYHELSQNDTLIRQDIKDAIRVTWQRAERYYKEQQQTVVTTNKVPLFYKILSIIAGLFIVYYILRLIAMFK